MVIMMKAPTHLRECTEPLKEEENKRRLFFKRYDLDNENIYTANIKCHCGNYVFEFLYPAGGSKSHPCTVEINDSFFFLLKAKCINCGEEHLLFDADFHGWDGWICHDEKQAGLPRPSLTSWKCDRCSSSKQRGVVIINSQGQDDFIEETGENFNIERWQDAFDWFTLDIRCEECNKEVHNFISYETM